jgi:hypothetical protein
MTCSILDMSGIQNYLNTIIFCIVAKTVTVFVLAFLVNEKVRWFSFFLLTIELGLIVVIITSMIIISRYDKKMADLAKQLRTSILTNIDCPDYYIRGTSAGSNMICSDSFSSPDGRFSYSFTSNIVPDNPDAMTNVKEIDMDANFNNKEFTKICETLGSHGSAYSNLSWTDLKAKCDWA